MSQRVELLAGQRQKGESYRTILACNDYLRMGPTRSLRKIGNGNEWQHPGRHSGRSRDGRPAKGGRSKPRSTTLRSTPQRRPAREIMQSGLVLDFERIAEFKWLGILE